AQAVQELKQEAKLGIGPYITDGFYFDFDVDEAFTPEDLKALEKRMQKIVNSTQSFRRRSVTHDEAVAEMADEPYK
ncbi:threonine--tRNA ligase, partial [Salmonella enterica subsp. enterica serovar Typhimurium]|nr:threonine--tRNA ligase [Salmonella enterica subsp. enterica serovar Typhimurium]